MQKNSVELVETTGRSLEELAAAGRLASVFCRLARNRFTGVVYVEHVGESFHMSVEGSHQVCSYAGTYRQEGRVGSVTGTYACTDGTTGTFTLSPLETTSFAIAGQIVATHPACAQTRQTFSGFSLTQVR